MSAGELRSARLRLERLSVDAAAEMVEVLADPALYEFTGGTPPSSDELTGRYRRLTAGPPPVDAAAGVSWHNWIVRELRTGAALGFVQATVHGHDAELAWVIGTDHQGHGYAVEAATTLLEALTDDGVDHFCAHVHPDHLASQRVAAALGLAPTAGRNAEGEVRWA